MLGLMGKVGSEQRCSKLSQGWNVVNKDLFLPALIAGSYTNMPRERALVCSVTISLLEILTPFFFLTIYF